MFNQNKNKRNCKTTSKQADSFVIDLRSRFEPLVVSSTAKSNRPSKPLSIKLPFLKEYSENKYKNDKNALSINLQTKSSASSFSLKNIFKKRPSLTTFFGQRQKSFLPFLRSSRRLSFDLIIHRNARRHFAKSARVRWGRLLKARGVTSQQSRKDAPAEYLVSWYRSVFAFMAALIFIILPFKMLAYFKVMDFHSLQASIMESADSALNNLASASDEAVKLDLGTAGTSFNKAAIDFEDAQKELSKVDDWLLSLASFSGDSKIKIASQGKKFLAAGVAGAEMGEHLSRAGAILLDENETKSWGKLIDAFVEHGGLALESAKSLQIILHDIKPNDLPTEYRERFITLTDQADMAVVALDSLLSSAQEIKAFLGVSQDKRYLLVFQNNAEMRGAGGFFGSYALVDIRDGQIRKIEVPAGGSYDTEAGMRTFVQAPKPLWLVNPRWYFWDANWWPDWPTTAKSLMWFYEKSDGPTVDGVISFTPDVLEDLLRITGPVDMQAEYGLTVSAENFWELIQTTVEKDNLKEKFPVEVALIPDSPKNQPKKIIGDLMAEIMERLPEVLTMENLPSLLGALEKNLNSKNIMLYFTDPILQSKAQRYGIDGGIRESKSDYLLIAHTNIAGQKSDRRMSDKIEHSAQVLGDGSIIDTLTIYRTHNGIKNEILSGVRNVDWLRVYVPAGSQLLSASGFTAPDSFYFESPDSSWEIFPKLAESENQAATDLNSGTKIYSENNKTVFANWVMTDPGETSIIRLRYRLPFKLKNNNLVDNNEWWRKINSLLNQSPLERFQYSLLVQKQPGARAADIDLKLNLPINWNQVWNYPPTSDWDNSIILSQDILQAAILEK